MIQSNLDNDMMIGMANAPRTITKTPVIVWIQGPNDSGTEMPNTPRVLFQNNKSDTLDKSSLIPLSIEDEPRILISCDTYNLQITAEDLQKVCDWVSMNKDLLLQHWNGQITSYEVYSKCKTK